MCGAAACILQRAGRAGRDADRLRRQQQREQQEQQQQLRRRHAAQEESDEEAEVSLKRQCWLQTLNKPSTVQCIWYHALR